MKQGICLGMVLFLLLCTAACGRRAREITVISREEGSGTRSAFGLLSGVEQNGEDRTYPRAEISTSTAVVLQSVTGNRNAIGYLSIGALHREVKPLEIDGVAPTAQNVQEGRYPLARAFLLGLLQERSPAVQDFLHYVLSDAGQEILSQMGYVSVSSGTYESAGISGTVRIAGSSSVAPVMEKLAEAYMGQNPAVTVQIQTSDSTTGLASLSKDLCDLAMSSRTLKESELARGIVPVTLCLDGIAVIVHRENPVNGLTMEQLRQIYSGELRDWTQLE